MATKLRITGVILSVLAALGVTTWLARRRKGHEGVVESA